MAKRKRKPAAPSVEARQCAAELNESSGATGAMRVSGADVEAWGRVEMARRMANMAEAHDSLGELVADELPVARQLLSDHDPAKLAEELARHRAGEAPHPCATELAAMPEAERLEYVRQAVQGYESHDLVYGRITNLVSTGLKAGLPRPVLSRMLRAFAASVEAGCDVDELKGTYKDLVVAKLVDDWGVPIADVVRALRNENYPTGDIVTDKRTRDPIDKQLRRGRRRT